MRSIRSNAGFTLFELLVATSVFAIVSYMAYSGLMQVLQARAHTEKVEKRLAQIQMAFLHLERDIQQAVNRPVRDSFGTTRGPVVGNTLGDYNLELTRTGRRNPLASLNPRSILQRVAYQLEDEKLYRVIWPVLDQAQQTEPRRYEILSDVRNIDIRYLVSGNNWDTEWPPTGQQASAAPPTVFPRAMAIELELTDMGKINRMFLMPEV